MMVKSMKQILSLPVFFSYSWCELSCYILPYNHYDDDDDDYYYLNYDAYIYDEDGVEVDDVDCDYCVWLDMLFS